MPAQPAHKIVPTMPASFIPPFLPKDVDGVLTSGSRLLATGVRAGVDALLLADLASKTNRPIIVIAINDAHMATLHTGLLAVGVAGGEIDLLPAWDCLPYDRTPPHPSIIGQRIACLARLAAADTAKPGLILTTVNAWLQRIPEPTYFATSNWRLKQGGGLTSSDFTSYAEANAYHQTTTVREAGEYALRGGLIDVFPPGAASPIRLDLFGDTIEAIKPFDAETQQTQAKATLASITLYPASELPLTEASIRQFRRQYIAEFGGQAAQDWLYQCVSSGQRPPGLDQYLPLFHQRLVHLLDYVANSSPSPIVVMADGCEDAIKERCEQIEDFYAARHDRLQDKASHDAEAAILPPLAAAKFYLTPQNHAQVLDGAALLQLANLKQSISNAMKHFEIKAKKGLAIHEAAMHLADKNKKGDDSIARLSHVIAGYNKKRAANTTIVIAANSSGSLTRIMERLAEYGVPISIADNLAQCRARHVNGMVWRGASGFVAGDLLLISEEDIYGARQLRLRPSGKRRADQFLRETSSIQTGDLLVHSDHGIGRYDGLQTLTIGDAAHDCLMLSYADGDRLYVPVENMDVLSRFGGESAPLDRLGARYWQARKARIKGRIRTIAAELIKIAAMRATTTATASIADPASFSEFCHRFPYAETADQLQAIHDVLGDMASGRVMDRLVCGDVGFGKTEVGLRAAFVAAMAGYQVVVVTPTTLLARQHAEVFARRFAGFGVTIRTLSRMTEAKLARRVKQELASGDCQIAIGTHALLAKSLEFSNLGLVIIDEEQRFGVAQKERLKELRGDIHVLTLTATPIPRTLQMALAGVRDMSLIATPPVDRLAIRTWVGAWDEVVLAHAIRYECHRGGQIFCVSPRISYLPRLHDRLSGMHPQARILTAHGRLPPMELDKAMQEFADGEADILLTTNIIESGIDLPRANTMLIHRADLFGLAQLYQLRGRIGRGKQRAHAYLTTPQAKLTADAKRRLDVMQTLDSLGAGFSLASYDLDIRGGGNLLGDEQSGHIREVGVELYQSMLATAVKQAKGAKGAGDDADWSPVLNLGATVLIPESYVADLSVRLSIYRRIANITSRDDQDALTAELIDRFGALPNEVGNLLAVMHIKRLCLACRVTRLDAGPKGISMRFLDNRFAAPDALLELLADKTSGFTATPDQKLILAKPLPKSERIAAARQVMEKLARLVE